MECEFKSGKSFPVLTCRFPVLVTSSKSGHFIIISRIRVFIGQLIGHLGQLLSSSVLVMLVYELLHRVYTSSTEQNRWN